MEKKNGPIANTSQYLHFTRLQLTEASHYLCRKPKTICTDCLDLTEVRIMYKITSTCLIHSDDTQPRKFSSVQRSLTSTETIRTVRDREFRMASSTFTQLLSSETVQCGFTSTETLRTIRDGEPRTATSTFTIQLLGSELTAKFQFSVTYVQRHRKDYYY